MKRVIIVSTVILLLVGIFFAYTGYHFSISNDLMAIYDTESITVVNEYHVDKKKSFLLFKDNYDRYGVAEIESFLVFDRVIGGHNTIANSQENILSHLAFWSSGYYFDYIFINDKSVEYVVVGDLDSISEYDGNILSIVENINRYSDTIIVHKLYEDTTCFWGYSKDETMKVGEITTFDVNGDPVSSEVIY